MPNVRFNLDNATLERSYLFLHFSYNGRRLKYSVGKKVPTKFWKQESQKVINKRGKFPQAADFNNYLKHLESETHKIYDRYRVQNKFPSIIEFREQLDYVTGKKRKEETKTLFSFIDEFIETSEKLGKTKGTITTYKQTRDILKAFTQKGTKYKSLDFKNINFSFDDDFKHYLSVERGHNHNYIGKTYKNLKTFLNDATRKGFNTRLDFKNFVKPSEEVDNIYLSITEINTLYKFDFSKNERLEKVRDLFVMGCFTGARFSDWSKITPENIQIKRDKNDTPYEMLILTPQKTGAKSEPLIIPVHPIVKEILNKYNDELPKVPVSQNVNRYIKEVAKLAGINESIQLNNSKSTKKAAEKWELVVTHTARRSFATNAFKSGIPTLSIMRITGHKTESSFMKYIKIKNEENAFLVVDNAFFKQASPLRKVM